MHRSKNRIKVITYSIISLYISAIIFAWYRFCAFTNIPGVSTHYSKVIFWTLSAIGLIISYGLTFQTHRTYLSAILNAFVPVGIYTIISYFKYRKVFMGAFGVLTVLIVIAAITVSVTVIIAKLRSSNKSLFSFRTLCTVTNQVIGGILAPMVIAIALIPGLGLPKVHPTVAKIPDDSFSDEYSVTENATYLSSLVDGEWSSLPIKDKLNCLQMLANAEKRYLGLPHTLNVEAVVLPYEINAQYEPKSHTIQMNIEFLENASEVEAMQSTAHEAYHAYERQLCILYDNADASQKELLVFSSVPDYKKEFNNYVSGEDNFEEYYNQIIESEARAYSYSSAKECMDIIKKKN